MDKYCEGYYVFRKLDKRPAVQTNMMPLTGSMADGQLHMRAAEVITLIMSPSIVMRLGAIQSGIQDTTQFHLRENSYYMICFRKVVAYEIKLHG